MNKVWGFLKVAIILTIVLYFVGSKVSSFNDSYEEKFCKSYNQWNKYAWAVRNNSDSIETSSNWQGLEIDEYSKLQKLVSYNDPYGEIPLSKYALQWFKDGEEGDLANGQVMASMIIIECEKIGVEIDRSYLPEK